MKTIGYVISHFPVFSETFIGNEMRAMRSQQYRIVPLAFYRGTGACQPQDREWLLKATYLSEMQGLQFLSVLTHLSVHARKALAFTLQQKGIKARSLLWHGIKLAYAAQQQGCDHLHAHFAQASAATAIVAARLLGISVSFVGHGYDVYASPADLTLKLRYADFAVAVCDDMYELFESLNPSGSIVKIHCGVDSRRFKPNFMEEQKNGRMLFVGRLCETKGLRELLMALACMKSIHRPRLDIVGTGEMGEELKKMLVHLKISSWVSLLGARDSEWIQSQASNYLCLVAPYKLAPNGDRDTGPLVVKEAMAMGLPIITTRFMGCMEMVDENCSLLVDPGSISQLAHAMGTMQSMSPAQRRMMGLCARQRVVSHYDLNLSATQLSGYVEMARGLYV